MKDHAGKFTYTRSLQQPHSDKLLFDGKARGGCSRVDVDFVEDGAYVTLHGTWADHQLFSHRAIAHALRDQE